MIMDKATRNKISYIYFILSVLVVYRHAVNVDVYTITNKGIYVFEEITKNISNIANVEFFAISAFLFYWNYDENKLKNKLKSRFFSLVVPYIVWNIIGWCYFKILSMIPFLRQYYGGEIDPLSIKDLIDTIINYKYNFAAWFLRALIIYTFVFPLFYRLFKNKTGIIITLLLSILIYYLFMNTGREAPTFLYSYVVGMYFAICNKNVVLKRYGNKCKLIAFVILVAMILLTTFGNYSILSLLHPFIRITEIICTWIVLDICAVNREPKEFMKDTFFIYLSHEMILEPIEKIVYLLFGDTNMWALFDYLFAPVLTIAILLLIAELLKKIKIYKYLVGGR